MDLHKEFVKLSFDIIRMKNKLISLLLEIYEKEIYRQYGCGTIFEYGFKYGRLSKEMIEKALRTLKYVEDKPFLKKAIETHGIHKVSMVATIATPETDKMFAQHVENMSKPALFEFAKEIRRGKKNEDKKDGQQSFLGDIESENAVSQKCQAVPAKITIELDEESQILFPRLKNKYAKDRSNKEALKVMLKKLEEKDVPGNGNQKQSESAETSRKINKKKFTAGGEPQYIPQTGQVDESPTFPSRYIPAQLKRKILEKYHNKCAYPNCVRPAEHFHHRTTFGFEQNHESIIPLCEIHHQFAHNGVINHESKEPEGWQLNTSGRKTFYDNLYLKYRNPE